VNLILRQFKIDGGAVNFPAVLSVPMEHRIPMMAKNDFNKINMLIIGALTMAFESMNLKRGMNEMQILDLSEAIIDTAAEDNLSFEDFMLFLQNMTWGKYEMSYESFDIPKFMKLFEIYRQQRYEAVMEYRENQHLEFKGLGSAERSTKPTTDFEEHLQQYTEKLQAKNDEIKLLRREAKDK